MQSAVRTPAIDRREIAEFYDVFSAKLLRDYVYGNKRIEEAVARVCAKIGNSTHTILDVGCGIGVSADAYTRFKPGLAVDAIDLSPRNIEIARALFPSPTICFSTNHLEHVCRTKRYDLIAMIDVYEHIPRAQWDETNAALKVGLAETGTVVLTTPSPLHQAWMAAHKPQGLQIVDETVTRDDIVKLAEDVEATITFYELVSVWRTYDYVHVVLTRAPRFEPLASQEPAASVWQRIIRKLRPVSRYDGQDAILDQRRRHVRELLGVDL